MLWKIREDVEQNWQPTRNILLELSPKACNAKTPAPLRYGGFYVLPILFCVNLRTSIIL
jgi:hypothetical protein